MEEKQAIQTVATFLNRGDLDFLDKLAKDSFFSTGSKVPRATLIAWMVDLLKGLNIDGRDIRSEEDLQKKLMKAVMTAEQREEKRNE